MTATKTRPPPSALDMSEFGQVLDAFLTMARANQTARALSLRVQHDPEPDKVMKRRMKRWDEAHQARAKAIRDKDRKALSAANSEIRKLQKEVGDLRSAQLEAADASRAALEATVMAGVRGEPIEEVETVIVDWVRDEHGARKIKRGRAFLVEERARALRIAPRTGLALAFESGHLDGGRVRAELLYDVGKRYRDAYEAVGRSGIGGINQAGPPSGGKASVGPGDAILDAALNLRTFRMGLTPRQRQVLDLICGQDMAVKATSLRLKAGIPSTKRALISGLTTAWENRNIG